MSLLNNRINKVLIANRGEIALRIKRAADSLNIDSCIVVSEADRQQSYVSIFEEKPNSIHVLPGASAAETYLNQALIIDAAKKLGANAIHPGYGFLSENHEFAKLAADNGLIFIGPSSQTILSLGSKTMARKLVTKVGVPVVPGTNGGLSNDELCKVAKTKIGLPLLIKASAGGGGRGMKIVRSWEELVPNLERARAEAKKFFSNEDVFIERYVENPRHVEVQLFGDKFGNIVHFGTRDCSAQRRYQKVIEEAPALCIDPGVIKKIESAAVKAAKAAKYSNAGTAEFIVSGKDFYFLEINTRIQVEHPVTEEAYNEDLVALQFKVANGFSFSKNSKTYSQKNIKAKKYSIELRIYSEDPALFAPNLGTINKISFPEFNPKQIRLEMGFKEGDQVLPYYDAMIGKVIVTGENRLQTIDAAYNFLKSSSISGISTNIHFLKWLLLHPAFRDGTMSIQQIEREFKIEMLDTVKQKEVCDLNWKNHGFTEVIHLDNPITIKKQKADSIKVIHRSDRTFLFVPQKKNGSDFPATHWVRSNSYKNGLGAFTEI